MMSDKPYRETIARDALDQYRHGIRDALANKCKVVEMVVADMRNEQVTVAVRAKGLDCETIGQHSKTVLDAIAREGIDIER